MENNMEHCKPENYYTSGHYWEKYADSDSSCKVDLVAHLFEKYPILAGSWIHAAEVGCGQGAFLFPLAKRFKDKSIPFDLIGYDISPDAIEIAKKRGNAFGDNLKFSVGSAGDVRNGLDIIFVMDVLEHVENPYQFLRDLAGKSKYLLVHLPIEHSIAHLLMRKVSRSNTEFNHIHFFSWESAKIMISESPFEIKDFQFTPSLGITIGLEKNILKKILLMGRYLLYKMMPRLSPLLSGGSVLLLLNVKGTVRH